MDFKNNVSQRLHCNCLCVGNRNVKLAFQRLHDLDIGKRVEIPKERKLLGEVVRVMDAQQVGIENLTQDAANSRDCIECNALTPEVTLPKLRIVERLTSAEDMLQF